MSPQAPAGWYADPGVPGQLRWWDGTDWAEGTVAPVAEDAAPAAAPAPPASAPEPSVRPSETPWRPLRNRDRLGTGTVWIWLAIVFSTLPFFTGSLFDPITTARFVGYLAVGPSYDPGVSGWASAGLVLLALLNVCVVAASIVFSWLDHRSLRRRGVEAPFAWGWSVLAFVATLGVYVVGRSVVVHGRTGRGLAPLWGWLVATVVGVAVASVWVVWFFESLWLAVTTAH